MGRELHEASQKVRDYYAQASDLLGDDLARVSFEGPAEKLKQTIFTQPAILIHSLALLEILGDQLTPEDAITAVCTRARLMEQACVANPGTMAAILALPDEKLDEVCRKAGKLGVVTRANINSAIQVTISGEYKAVEEACRLAKEAGAKRAVMLEVGGAFHSPLMATATAGMAECLDSLDIKDANPPVVANVTARPVTRASEIRRLLVEQITSPVRWRDTMAFFVAEGATAVVEIGPGKVLAGLAKRDMPGVNIYNIDNLADAETLLAAVPGQEGEK
jgi:[acyl-carrier-protein] S-malonyltransferase